MDERTLSLLTLRHLPGFGNHRIASLFRVGGLHDLLETPRAYVDQIGEDAVASVETGSARRQAERVIESAARHGQAVVPLGHEAFPSTLAAIYDPPPVLFVRGEMPTRRRVAIVGARAATPAGRSLARDLARGLAAHGIEVVSGLARGVDGAAHEGALSGRGTTLAVLGSGLDVIYPAEHQDLASRIERQGAILSEQLPGTRPAPAHFPSRNRIIVGLSEAVIVIEAGSRSGALITARVALDEGRDVLAVPGRPADPLAYGPNLLIRDGATLIRGIDDVLQHLGLDAALPKAVATPPDPILRHLSGSAVRSVDQLVVDTGFEPSSLMVRLAEMEIEGKIERLPGTLFRATGPA